jgi:hypothetical protein
MSLADWVKAQTDQRPGAAREERQDIESIQDHSARPVVRLRRMQGQARRNDPAAMISTEVGS